MTVATDMSLDTIIAKLRALEPQIRAHGVTRLALFGSRVRGDHRPDSDLDVLIDVDPSGPFGWKDLAGIVAVYRDATGLETQVSLQSELKPRFAERIADDLTEVF